MNIRKSFVKILALVCILACIFVASSMFVAGNEVGSSKINFIMGVPSSPVDENGTFNVTVKIANDDITSFKLAGIEVDLFYNTSKLSVASVATNVSSESTALAKDKNGVVKFICVKNEFTAQAGYTTLNNLFTVTFKANEAISNPALLFNESNVTYLLGNVTAFNLADKLNSVYGADKVKVAEAILNSNLSLTVSEKAGTIIVVPTPASEDAAMTKTELEESISNNKVSVNSGEKIGTGSTISVDDEEVEIVVKGDVNGDGIANIYDAIMIYKATKQNAGAADSFEGKEIKEFAGDVDSNGTTNADDVDGILEHILGRNPIG